MKPLELWENKEEKWAKTQASEEEMVLSLKG